MSDIEQNNKSHCLWNNEDIFLHGSIYKPEIMVLSFAVTIVPHLEYDFFFFIVKDKIRGVTILLLISYRKGFRFQNVKVHIFLKYVISQNV